MYPSIPPSTVMRGETRVFHMGDCVCSSSPSPVARITPALCCRVHERFRRTRPHRVRRLGCGAPRGESCGQAARFAPADPEAALQLERNRQCYAEDVSREGARLARSLGLDAAALAVADAGGIAETILDLASEHHAAAIVIGSRGLSGLRARLEGSTSKSVSKRASCPVLVYTTPGRATSERVAARRARLRAPIGRAVTGMIGSRLEGPSPPAPAGPSYESPM
jgi:nucleotide-binding universal stress UspA family protein